MAQLARAVHLTDPKTKRSIVLQPGEEPAPYLAALITTPSAWEDGQVPASVEPEAQEVSTSSRPEQLPEPEPEQAATAAKKPAAKKTAASSRSRGRAAAGEGDSGE